MIEERDKPLSFHWQAEDEGWTDVLNLPPTPSKRREETRAAILIDALIAHQSDGCTGARADTISTGWVSYSRNRNWWAGTSRYFPYTLRDVLWAVKQAALLGWLEHEKAPAGLNVGRQSRFRASSLLVEATKLPEVSQRLKESIVLKASNKRLIDYRDTIQTEHWRREVEAQNEALLGTDIRLEHPEAVAEGNVIRIEDHVLYPRMKSLYRVFNGDWRHGGRNYGGWWQNAKKEHRPYLAINGEATVELDYSQIHPQLLYRMEGVSQDGDAYTLPGWPRDLCKRAWNILINAETYPSALGAVSLAVGIEYGQGQNRTKAADLIQAMKDKHAPISRHFHSGVGLRLQALDAAMAENVMKRLRKQGIVALPIHDSFVVQDRHEGALAEAMEAAFQAKIA